MARCKNCLIPDAAPEISLFADGVCNICHEQTGQQELADDDQARKARAEDLEQAIKACVGQAEYECLVPFSGGKDSCYLLYRLKEEYGLKVLAFTVDVNIPPIAWDNIRRTLSKLDIDHLTYSPPRSFYEKLFRYLLKNQEERGAVYTVSYVYAPLFEGEAIKFALEKNIPVVLAGYSPGQPVPERMLYEFSRKLICEADWTPPELSQSGEFSTDELKRFFNPAQYPTGSSFPRYLAPYHAWEYDQDMIMRKVVELDLVASSKHASPLYSNYPINWLLMYSDIKTFGYNPYAPEFSALIRQGKANRNFWRVMMPLVDFMILKRLGPGREVTRSLQWLGLEPGDLRITKARGAYDPVIS